MLWLMLNYHCYMLLCAESVMLLLLLLLLLLHSLRCPMLYAAAVCFVLMLLYALCCCMLYAAATCFILQLYTTVCLQAAAPSARYLEVHIERAVAVDERRVLPRGELAHPN